MSFIEIQNEFMAHIREPQKNKKPSGIEDRRMAIYRDLFFNNIEGFISSGFPVLKTLYTQKLDVSIAHEDEQEKKLQTTALTSSALYLSKTARNLSYQFPVQNISNRFKPKEPSPQPNYFVVYRDENDDVQFLATNAMTALLLSIIEASEGATFDNICQQVLAHAPQFNAEQITQGALVTLNAMVERGVIVTKNQD